MYVCMYVLNRYFFSFFFYVASIMSSISSIDFFVGDFLCHFVELFLEKGIFCENFLFLGEKNSKLIFFNLKIHKILAQLFPTMNERVLRIFY